MVSILKKIFDMQLLFPVLIMFCSKIITHLQGQMVDVFELFDLWYIFMTKYARVHIIESQ